MRTPSIRFAARTRTRARPPDGPPRAWTWTTCSAGTGWGRSRCAGSTCTPCVSSRSTAGTRTSCGNSSSAAGPLRRAALVERRVELGVVLPLHQQGLGHRLELDRGRKAHVLLPGQQDLGLREGLDRAGGQPPGEGDDLVVEGVLLGQEGDQPDPFGLLGV